MTKFQDLIKEIKSLKPMPAIAGQLTAVIDDPACSAKDIADLIKFDPSATANLLKTCNSAYYGLSKPVDSVKDAVSILGVDTIIQIVLFQSGIKTLSKEQKGYGLHEGVMWRHAVSSAIIAKSVSEKSGIGQKNIIFTAALLKDIGKTILDRYVSDSFEKIVDLVTHKRYSFREAEKKVLGIDHAELGAMIAKIWNFSPRMVHIIRHHHLAEVSQRNDMDIAIVYLADCICMMMGIGIGTDGLAYRFHEDVIKSLKMTHKDISMTIADFSINLPEIEKMTNMVR